jgi:dUTP pyrophosphatase
MPNLPKIYHTGSLVKAHPSDAAYDLSATQPGEVRRQTPLVCNTGVRLQLPDSYIGLILGRSGLAYNSVFIPNAPGLIDQGYRGELQVILSTTSDDRYYVEKGERIAQLLILKASKFDIEQLEEVSFDTDRGVAGLGSTGKKELVVS